MQTHTNTSAVKIALGINEFILAPLAMKKTTTEDARTLPCPHLLAHFAPDSQSSALAKAYPPMAALDSGHRSWTFLLEFDLNWSCPGKLLIINNIRPSSQKDVAKTCLQKTESQL